ncbi:hypothetical protein IFM89_027102 [Coptis chinensis]|uniref:Glucose-methanol-choline oxidoreductase N-terminal domain-containing protein n=1 Tax=Coptis chinensis TaxID=261450 RepID=A0A835MDL8_9MAGN|nr:hypothetical protein IFM89_027102 [Coptis chinensis]
MHERKKQRNRSTATGVSFEFVNGKEKEVYFVQSKVTIVAGGAFGTPILLKRSGLKNENIGKHLHLHPVVMSWGYFPNAKNSSAWPEEYKKSYEGGIMTAMSTVVGEFSRSGYGCDTNSSITPGLFSAVMPWVSGADMKERMSRFSRTAHLFALARDKAGAEEIGTHHFTGKKLNVKRGNTSDGELQNGNGSKDICGESEWRNLGGGGIVLGSVSF